MAVRIKTTYFSMLGRTLYLKFKITADRSFAFKFKRFKQRSSFWYPDRWLIYASFFSVELTIEHRRILPQIK